VVATVGFDVVLDDDPHAINKAHRKREVRDRINFMTLANKNQSPIREGIVQTTVTNAY
jgi:hypothetical protein